MSTMERFLSTRHVGEGRPAERANALAAYSKPKEASGPRLGGGPNMADMTQDDIDDLVYKSLIGGPVEYADLILGCYLSEKQKEILEMSQIYSHLAVAGANACGKTFAIAPKSLWELTFPARPGYWDREEVCVMQISPTREQAVEVFWGAMRALYRRSEMARHLLNDAQMYKTKIEPSDLKKCLTVSPSDEHNIRGFHAERNLFLLDEGNGIDATVFDAMFGIEGGGDSSYVQLGNPTANSGLFYDCWDNPDLGWKTMNISCFDSPNLLSLDVPDWFTDVSNAPGEIVEADRVKLAYLDYLHKQYLKKRDTMQREDIPEYRILYMENPVPYLTRRDWVARAIPRYAFANNPTWFGRVLGVAPDFSDNQLFRRSDINRARTVSEWVPGRGPILFGCDPSGQGQAEWVLQGIQVDNATMKHYLVVDEGYQGEDDVEQAIARMQPFVESGNCFSINIDRMGPGERPSVEIKRWAAQFGVPVHAFVSQQASTNPQMFYNLKSQAFFHLNDLFRTGMIEGVSGDLLRRQLLTVHFDRTSRGQFQMETKEKMRKRGVLSPDRADALAYACFPLYNMVPTQTWIGA